MSGGGYAAPREAIRTGLSGRPVGADSAGEELRGTRSRWEESDPPRMGGDGVHRFRRATSIDSNEKYEGDNFHLFSSLSLLYQIRRNAFGTFNRYMKSRHKQVVDFLLNTSMNFLQDYNPNIIIDSICAGSNRF